MSEPSIVERYGRIVSCSQPCTGVSFASFLRHAHGQPRFYWENHREPIALAGLGSAVELTAWGAERFQAIEQQLRDLFTGVVILNADDNPLLVPRVFGGFSFRADFSADQTWTAFSPAQFVLPHYQLIRIGDQQWLTITVQLPIGENPADIRGDLLSALDDRIALLRADTRTRSPALTPATPLDVRYPLPYPAWEANIQAAIQQMHAGDLQKVVLARFCAAHFAEPVNVDHALADLAARYGDCYRFLFEPQPNRAFFGATPELLAALDGRDFRTMALAGSVRRGTTPAEDAAYRRELLHDPKERHEHQLVIDAIAARLQTHAAHMTVHETGVLTLSNIQHLHTPITARLKPGQHILHVVEHLHPTPALGGAPRAKAMQVIETLEQFPRGWYAAPVGWVDYQLNGQFAVAIRSAISQERRAWLYAGAGIVPESIPQKEWDETALKFRPMLQALGLQHE